MGLSARTVRLSITAAIAVAAVAYLATRGSGSDPAPFRATVLKHESLIAQCMHDHGFEYVVSLPNDVVAEEAGRAAAQQGRDPRAAIRDAQRQAPPDPNDVLVGKLPPDRQLAWGDALYGNDTSPGCYYETYKAAWGVDLGTAAARGEDHLARVKADPAVRAAERTYVGCMAARGYQVATAEDIFALIGHQRDALEATAAEEFARSATAAHDTCAGPYQKVFDTVYTRLSAR